MAEEVKEYTEDMQKLYVEFLLSDSELYARCQAILDAEYFDRKFRKSVKFIQEHVSGYSALPTPEQIKAEAGIEFTLVPKSKGLYSKAPKGPFHISILDFKIS